MKNIITAAAMLFSMTAFAQVGINNTSPKATLDITAKTTDGSKPEGLIIPQLSGDKIHTATTAGVYGPNQKGLIVYASTADSAPAGATASITAPGYYYFDGGAWQKIATGNTLNTSLASGNIYIGNTSNVATAVTPTGDVTISNAGITSIGAGKVTNTHMASAAALTIKGNATNAAASPTDIAAGTDGYVLRRSGTALGFGTVATVGIADGAVTSAKIAADAITSTQIATGTVTNADLASAAALTVKGNATSAAASPTDIAAGTDGYVLRRSGTALGFGTVATAGIADGAVTTAKIAADAITSTQIATGAVSNADLASAAALTVKGNATNAAASPTDIAAGTDGYVLRRSGTSLGFGTVATAGIADGAVTANKMTLSNGKIYVGNSSGAAAEVSLSGDATMDNTGAASIVEGKGGIYKGNGALSKNTTVNQGGYTLAFTSNTTNGFSVDGTTLSVDGANNRVGIGTNAPSTNLEINSGTLNDSGLKLTQLTSSTSATSGNVAGIGVDNNGKIVVVGGSTQVNRYTFSSSPAQGTNMSFIPNINSQTINLISGSSRSGNVITLPQGTYEVVYTLGGGFTGASIANYFDARLYVNNSFYQVLASYSTSGTNVGFMTGVGVFTLSSSGTIYVGGAIQVGSGAWSFNNSNTSLVIKKLL
ncbi:hypothetical protein [Chryseobacterium sp. POE27]|uniref:beta strand repeat-containing protein n=1 Tax=Chryseobacterium sp. POE27 TaxID=3138177 RepID=UPI003218EB1F